MRPILPWCEGLFPSSLTLSHLYLTWYTLFPWKRNVPINLAGGQPLWEWELKFHNSLNMLIQRYKSLNNLKIPGMETESGRTVGETCERGFISLFSSTEAWKTISPCRISSADRALWDSSSIYYFPLTFQILFPIPYGQARVGRSKTTQVWRFFFFANIMEWTANRPPIHLYS